MPDVSRRKSDITGDPVQRSLLVRVIAYGVLYLALSFIVGISLNAFGDPMRTFALSWKVILRDQFASLVAAIALLPIFLRDMARTSGRFSGPMVRLHHAMRSAIRGETYVPLNFRESDFWQDLAQDFNQLMEERVLERHREEEHIPHIETSEDASLVTS